MIFTYNTGDVIAFGIILSLILIMLVVMGIAAVRTVGRKITEAVNNAFQFNNVKER